MTLSLRHIASIVAVLALAGCSRYKTEPAPAPAGAPAAPPTRSQAATYEQVMTDVNEGEESYLKMAIAAGGYVRHLVPGKVIGFLQPDLKSPAFRDMVEQVTKTYAYRPIRTTDYKVVCQQPPNNPVTVTTATATCSMFLVDVGAQFEVTRMTLDSGWVGGSTTQVPRGGVNAEETAFCITLARDGSGWKAVRSIKIEDRRRC